MKTLTIFASILLILHGLIHLMGTVTYTKLGTVPGLTYKTTLLGRDIGASGMSVYGTLWAVAAVGFIVAAVATLAGWEWWRPALVAATLFSLVLTSLEFREASFGAILNITILAVVGLGPTIAGWVAR